MNHNKQIRNNLNSAISFLASLAQYHILFHLKHSFWFHQTSVQEWTQGRLEAWVCWKMLYLGNVFQLTQSHKEHSRMCEGSVHFSCSVMSNSLWPQGLQHTRPPCSSPTPRAYSHSCSSSRWCHPTISSSVIPFSSCLQSSQHQGLFQWLGSSHQVAQVLEL